MLECKLNNRPRKRLGFKTSNQVIWETTENTEVLGTNLG